MRLNRFLSICGLGSRRGCEQIILDGRVMINGHRVTSLGITVGDGDQVSVDGKPVFQRESVVIALNKPKGYICTRSDTHDRLTIYDLLPPKFQHLHHVGRLDQDSEGLILLTNSGELSQRLTHPSQGVEKEYEVRTEKPFDQSGIFKLQEGFETPEGFAKAERAWIEHAYLVHVVLKQGLKRQIRHMFFQLGNEVERLTRIRIGGVKVKGLSKGSWRQLTANEIEHDLASRPSKAAPTVRRAKVDTDGDDEFASSSKKAAKPAARRPRKPIATRSSNPKPYVPKDQFHGTSLPSIKKASRKESSKPPRKSGFSPRGKGRPTKRR